MKEAKSYPRDTAGAELTNKVPTAHSTSTIAEVVKQLLEKAGTFQTINYIYVLDSHNKLVGVTSIKNLLAVEKESYNNKISEIMATDVVSVRPHSHRERAAQLALKYNIKAIPVTDSAGTLLGVIDSDKVLSIMHDEKTEDLLMLSGVSKSAVKMDDVMTLSIFDSFVHRIPWLLFGLFAGLVTAETITFFDSTLEQNLIIASFIPMMVYMSNAVAQQINAFLVRDTALHEHIPYTKYFMKQFATIFLIALLMSVILLLLSNMIYKDFFTAKVLGTAMFGTVLSSILTGFLIPFFLIKLDFDPANASGPLGTALQDFLSILIYFIIASSLL